MGFMKLRDGTTVYTSVDEIPQHINALGFGGTIIKEPKPYKCPVCIGRGFVSNGFYSFTSNVWISTGGTEPCRTCGGTGVVWK